MAGGLMKEERQEHTLQPTALVHEAFLRLRPNLADAANRRYLFAAARNAMRRVLIDWARAHSVRKRAFNLAVQMAEGAATTPDPLSEELFDLLAELAKLDPRQHAIVEYRYFVGLTVEQVAEQLGLSRSTVEKDWRCARAWLYRRLNPSP